MFLLSALIYETYLTFVHLNTYLVDRSNNLNSNFKLTKKAKKELKA